MLVANRSFKYRSGRRSHVLYIGTTKKGARRPAASAVEKALDVFGEFRGLKQLGVYVLNCDCRRNVRTWKDLESSLLAVFRQVYFELPKMNRKRGGYASDEEVRYFKTQHLREILRSLEEKPRL
jgi:hypothetical protein